MKIRDSDYLLIILVLYAFLNAFFIFTHYLGYAGENERVSKKKTINFLIVHTITPLSISFVIFKKNNKNRS